MKLKPYDIKQIPDRDILHYKKTKMQELLEEFIDSGNTCCEVENYTHKSATICATTLRASARRYGFHQLGVICRGERVFLILEDEK